MQHRFKNRAQWNFLVLFIFCISCIPFSGAKDKTPLDHWVAKDDGHFQYRVVKGTRENGLKIYEIQLDSQKWLTKDKIDRVLWQHWMTIIVPDMVRSNASLLFISGGSNNQTTPNGRDDRLISLAQKTGSIVGSLKQVPNQPLQFSDAPKPLFEDALIAFAWDKYLKSGDPTWLPRLPMTKSAVKAMDTISDFINHESRGLYSVNKFVVAGASKRGWTTWTTAVVDKRVIGIAPIVIDMLNVVPSFEHHWEAYGFYAPAVGDYERNSIMTWKKSPEFQSLLKIVEPYEYRERLTLPKYIINSAGDEYFLPDSWKFYWNDLKGQKYLRYIPNSDHSLSGSNVVDSLSSFFNILVQGTGMPELNWSVQTNGQLLAETNIKPEKVLLWQATNPKARDFRLESFGAQWKSKVISATQSGTYKTQVKKPDSGWSAFLLEFHYPGHEMILTTGTQITPDFLPFNFDTGKPRSKNEIK